jgi:hypothetical protein
MAELATMTSEEELDEGIRDFLKKVGKRATSKVTQAIKKRLGRDEPEKKPEPTKPKPRPSARAKPQPQADEKASRTTKADETPAQKRTKAVVAATKAKRTVAAKKRSQTIKKKRKADMAAAAAENKAKRAARKKEIAAREKKGIRGAKEKVPADLVPAQIAHCMLALKHKRGKSTRAAWNICRYAMTKYGYLSGPYRVNTKLPKAVKQTQKGSRRSFQHGMEKGPLNKGIPGTGPTKYRKFRAMFREIETAVTPKKGIPGVTPRTPVARRRRSA